MRRLTLAVAVLVALAMVLSMGAVTSRIGVRAPVYYVIANNATSIFRRGRSGVSLGVYVCNDTDDQVEIQAAIDAAAASGWVGAAVELSDGRFNLGEPSGQIAYGGVCETATVGNVSRLDVSSWDGSYTQADVTVGDIIRLSHDGAGTDPADNQDDVCYTVTATTSGTPDTITLHGQLETNYDGGDTVNFDRIVCSIVMASGVTLKGQGVTSTRLRPLNGENTTAILVPKGSSQMALRDFDIRPQTNASSYDQRQNGLIVAKDVAELNIESVSVWYIGGDGITFNNGHGVRLSGDTWTEANKGRGIVVNSLDELTIYGHMFVQNAKDDLLVKRSDNIAITDCYGTTTGGYWLRTQLMYQSVVHGNRIVVDTGAAGGIYLDGGDHSNSICNNSLHIIPASLIGVTFNEASHVALTSNAIHLSGASTIGVDLGNRRLNTVIGNTFELEGAGSKGIDTTGTFSGSNQVHSNTNTVWSADSSYVRATNNSGSEITVYYFAMRTGTIDEIAVATQADEERCLGALTLGAIANGASGMLCTQGRHNLGPINAAEGGGQAIAVGDRLMLSGSVDGTLIEATSGKMVIAIALATQTETSGVRSTAMHLLSPGERYLLP